MAKKVKTSKAKVKAPKTVMIGSTAVKVGKPLDLVIAFDCTGSMSSCIAEVRSRLQDVCEDLWGKIPKLKIGIMAFGDYCDPEQIQMQTLDLSDNKETVNSFIRNSSNTGGGDGNEFYEKVLHDAQKLSWRPKANKVMMLLGDDSPHASNYAVINNYATHGYDWKEEIKELVSIGVKLTTVRCLNWDFSEPFWKEAAELGGGHYLRLAQFGNFKGAVETIGAVAIDSTYGKEATVAYYNHTTHTREGSRTMDFATNMCSLTGHSMDSLEIKPDLAPPTTKPINWELKRSDGTSWKEMMDSGEK